jgi:predicted enzyme related to lactoylglutathione lyase
MPKTFPRGRICWTELTTTDPKAAQAFYRAVVGWGTQPWDMDPSYVMWTAGGTPVGGLTALSDEAKRMGAPPGWMMSVAVPDVDASVRQATSLGARTSVEPQDIPTMGRFAVLRDPQGATFAVFTSKDNIPGHDGPSKPGEFSWHELATSDPQKAWSFYEQLFGWDKMDAMDMGATGTYQMFGRAGEMLGGVYNKPREMMGPPNWLNYALVPDVDSAVKVVQRLGGRIINGPMDVPGGGRIAQCIDLQGVAFALHSIAAPRKAAAKPKRSAKKAAAKKPAKKPAKKAAKKAKKKAKKAAKKAKKAAKKKKR